MPRRSKLEAAEAPPTEPTAEEANQVLAEKLNRYKLFLEKMHRDPKAPRVWDEPMTPEFILYKLMVEAKQERDQVLAAEKLLQYQKAKPRQKMPEGPASGAKGIRITYDWGDGDE